MNLEKLADKIEEKVLGDPSVARAMAKLCVNDLEEPVTVVNPPEVPIPDVFPLTCKTKNCCIKIGEGNLFEFVSLEFLNILGKGHIFTLEQDKAHVGECSTDPPGARPGTPAVALETFIAGVEKVFNNSICDQVIISKVVEKPI